MSNKFLIPKTGIEKIFAEMLLIYVHTLNQDIFIVKELRGIYFTHKSIDILNVRVVFT